MHVLVIGGTGFVGPHIVARLANLGYHVTVYHRGEHEPALPSGVRHVHSQLAAQPVEAFPPELTDHAWDVVLHMTAMGERDARATMRRFHGIARRIVMLSSGDVYRAYGICVGIETGAPEPVPLSEDAPLRSRLYPYRGDPRFGALGDFYEKIAAEREILSDPDLPGTILRLPAVYGPGDPQRRFAGFLRRMEDRRPTIPLSKGYARWRWTHGYVDDVAHAIVLSITRGPATPRIYNVGESETPTTAERVRRLGTSVGWKGEVLEIPEGLLPEPFPKPLDFRQDVVVDTSRIRRELEYREVVPEAEALARAADWERDHSPDPAAAPPPDYDSEDRALRKVAGDR